MVKSLSKDFSLQYLFKMMPGNYFFLSLTFSVGVLFIYFYFFFCDISLNHCINAHDSV